MNNTRVQLFTADGTFVRAWGLRARGNGYFHGPHGVAFDPDGNLIVTDIYLERIQTFTADGTFTTGWGEYGQRDGEFADPTGVATDADSRIYIADHGNDRIQVFAYPE